MEKIFKYGFFLLAIAVVVMVSFRGPSSGDKLYLEELENKVNVLSKTNLLLEQRNSSISEDLSLKKDSIIVLESEIAEIEYKKILLTRYYEKRIKNIDNLDVSQLDSLFTARYGE